MKVCVILLSLLILMGCGKQIDPAPEKPGITDGMPQTQEASAEPERSETKSVDNAYTKGVVTRKNGKKVAGHILLQCPGYLTVCFKINSSEPGSSELVPIEDVKSVVLEGSVDDVDPFWKELQEEMTVVFDNTEEAATEGVIGAITLDGQPVGNATVELMPVDGGKRMTGRTNTNGQYEFEKGVTPGNYRVRIIHENSPSTGEGTTKTEGDIGKKSEGGKAEVESGR